MLRRLFSRVLLLWKSIKKELNSKLLKWGDIKLYDKKFIEGLPNPENGWKSSLVVYVAKESTESHRQLKQYLERWYRVLPKDKKASYYSRLRSLQDKEFIAQIFEFFVADFCRSHGSVNFDPTLPDGKTPELLWCLNEQECLLDVVTLFDAKDKAEIQKGIDDLLNYLSSIEHFYDICVRYESIDLKKLKMSSIKKKLIEYLDSLDYESISPEEELIIDEFGVFITFMPVPKQEREKASISFAILGPPKEIEPVSAIEKRIKSKLAKYKWNGPIFVAVCKSADFGVDWDDLASVLYGEMGAFYTPAILEAYQAVKEGGLIMPRRNGIPQNTSLTGVLYCELKWGSGLPYLRVKYLKNPFAKHPVELPIPSYPTYDCRTVRFEWVNNVSEDLGSH